MANSPWVLLLCALIGTLVGLMDSPLTEQLSLFGELYLRMLEMCVIPLFAIAVIASLGRLIRDRRLGRSALGVVAFFGTSCLAASLLGLGLGLVFSVGDLGREAQKQHIGALLQPVTGTVHGTHLHVNRDGQYARLRTAARPAPPPRTTALIGSTDERRVGKKREEVEKLKIFLTNLVPSNVFQALSSGNHIGILWVSVFIGVALGRTKERTHHLLLDTLDGFFAIFMQILEWLLLILPLGVLCLFARNIADLPRDWETVRALVRFVLICWTTVIVLCGACLFVLSRRLSDGALTTLSRFRQPLVVAFSSQSSLVAMPLMMDCIRTHERIKRHVSDVVIPLGVNLHPFGSVVYFALGLIFTIQISGQSAMDLAWWGYPLMVFGAAFAGMAAGGIPGPSSIVIIGTILLPLDIATEVGVVTLIVLNVALDPFFTTLNVMGNLTATSFLADRPEVST